MDDAATLSANDAEAIDRRCDAFEASWRAGKRPRYEDHLAGGGGFREALAAELIAVELEWRRRLDASSGFLETLSLGPGAAPHVLLRDTDGGSEPPVHRPRAGDDPNSGTRYRIDGEIARGGMGAVLKGRDPDIGRDVALKVLREDFRGDPEMVRRFVEEAQIAGQLQHPGVVPIYEMGALGDRRPFFAMKLVKGDTLAKLLAGRKGPGDDRPRFLSTFAAIAQTMAYAHARGVIHRDLKPSNVMVGAFGEVQVMDWGLAKVLPRGGLADDAAAGRVPHDETTIATARSGSEEDSELSRAGSVLGTPSYMAPEQARGEVDRVDERCDVFALGSILCEVLTGKPAITGATSVEIQRKAAGGDLSDAIARLDSSGAEADLIALAKDCLAREPEDRPRTAAAVSDRITSYLSGVQERLRKAELKGVEERARRRLTTVVAASLILLSLLGGGGYVRSERQRADRRAKTARAVDEALADASRLRGEALSAPPGDSGRWAAAVAASKRAESVLAEGEADPSLSARVEEMTAGVERDHLAAAEKARGIETDQVLLADLETVRGNRVDHRDLKRSDAEYAEVFLRAGVDLDVIRPEEASRWLASRTEPIEMAGYLDDWAFVRKRLGRPEADWLRLAAAARVGDPDPWRDALRAKFGRDDAETLDQLRRLADAPDGVDQPAPGLLLLARVLKYGCSDGARAARVLRRAARRYPGDFRVHLELALAPGATVEAAGSSDAVFPDPTEAARHLTAALGIRPSSASTHLILSAALIAGGKLDEAEAECREAVRLRPDSPLTHAGLGGALNWEGKHEESDRELREAIRLAPLEGRYHAALAGSLNNRLRPDEAIVEYREAIRLQPDGFPTYLRYANALRRKTDYVGALAVARRAQALSGYSLVDFRYPPEWFERLETLAALSERLLAILKGDDRPKDAAESVDVGQMCTDKRLFAAALRFRSRALQDDPELGESRTVLLHYRAACSALKVAAGLGDDAPCLDEPAKAELRLRALGWLRAEIASWSAVFKSGPQTERERGLSVMRWWTRDSDLAAVRGAEALAKLPEAERKNWQAFWVEYEALMRKGEGTQPR